MSTPAPTSGGAATRGAPLTVVCDYGSLWTKATLFGAVRGEPRLIATSAVPTAGDADAPRLPGATEAALRALRSRTGLPPSAADGDRAHPPFTLLPAGSAAPSLDVVLIGPDRGAARRAAARIEGATCISRIRAGGVGDLLEESAPVQRPDVVVLVEGRGGIPAGRTPALAQLLARLGTDTRLVPVVHVRPEGTPEGASVVLGRAEAEAVSADLTARRPEGIAAVRRALDRLYTRRALARAYGAPFLPVDASTPFLSAVAALAITTGFAAGEDGLLALDVGASSVTICHARGDEVSSMVLTGVGLGVGAAALLDRAGADGVRRWLPFEPEADELGAWALNRSIEPAAVPLTPRETLIEQAFAREAALLGMRALELREPPARVVGCGALARGMRPQAAAAALLDALRCACPSWQRAELLVDTANLLPSLGALAAADAETAARVWEKDAPPLVATTLAARCAKRGTPALTATLHYGESTGRIEIPEGTVRTVRPPYGETGTVDLVAARGVRLPGTRRAEPLAVELSPSPSDPLPQLLVDTRTGEPRPEGRAEAAAADLRNSGALAATDLEAL